MISASPHYERGRAVKHDAVCRRGGLFVQDRDAVPSHCWDGTALSVRRGSVDSVPAYGTNCHRETVQVKEPLPLPGALSLTRSSIRELKGAVCADEVPACFQLEVVG